MEIPQLVFSYYTRKPVAPPPLFSKPVTPPPPPPPSNTPLEEACSAYSKTLSTLLSLIILNEVSTKVWCYIHTHGRGRDRVLLCKICMHIFMENRCGVNVYTLLYNVGLFHRCLLLLTLHSALLCEPQWTLCGVSAWPGSWLLWWNHSQTRWTTLP